MTQPQENLNWNALNWINNHLASYTALEPKHIQNILYFALIWNLFEDKFCGHHATVDRFEQEINNLSLQDNFINLEITPHLLYFRQCYITNEHLNNIFDKLSFRRHDREDLVKDVLLGKDVNFSDQILALLIIVYRLRSNLFHAKKEVWGLYGQEENFSQANQFLTKLLDMHQN